MRSGRDELEAGLEASFERFLAGYQSWGGYRFHGWTDERDPRNYRGPAIWSEADCVLRLARELEVEFPDRVHAELKIAKWTRDDFDPAHDRVQSIDLAVTDFSSFEEDASSQHRFRTWQHEIFIEAKWLGKGWWGEAWEMDARGQVPSIEADVMRLARHVELDRCLVAGMLVVDDECFFEAHSEDFEWPPSVRRLVASPVELERRGLADDAVAAELARIAELREREAERIEAKRVEQERLEKLAASMADDLTALKRRLGALTVKEFEAVTARAVADNNAEVLVTLEAHARTKEGKRWNARFEQIREALTAIGQAEAPESERFCGTHCRPGVGSAIDRGPGPGGGQQHHARDFEVRTREVMAAVETLITGTIKLAEKTGHLEAVESLSELRQVFLKPRDEQEQIVAAVMPTLNQIRTVRSTTEELLTAIKDSGYGLLSPETEAYP